MKRKENLHSNRYLRYVFKFQEGDFEFQKRKLPHIEGVRIIVVKEATHIFVLIASRLEVHGTKFRSISFCVIE